MPPVLAEMNDDAVRPRQLAERGGQHRIGFNTAACLTDGGHMIDIDGEIGHGNTPW